MYKNKAFTLVELMITVAIIGILTGMASLAYSVINQRGRDAQRMNDLNQIKVALTTYYNAQLPLQYVTETTAGVINGTSDTLSAALIPNYIRVVPVDPINSGTFVYKYSSQNSAKDFTLTASLENVNNQKGWAGGSQWVADGYQIVDN